MPDGVVNGVLPDTERAFLADFLAQSAAAAQRFAADEVSHGILARMADSVVRSIRGGGKLLLAGNGGSAGDAQHIAAEFTGRMLYDRPPLPAMALHVDTSALTAIGNDYGFEQVFARQVAAMGRTGDVLLVLSTSGNSPNVLRAVEAARAAGLATLGFTGAAGGAVADGVDLVLRAPSRLTPVVQQVHITAGHLLCALVERMIYPPAG